MWSKLRPRSFYDVLALIGCFAAVTTGGAYAAATLTGADIVDDSITSADIKGHPASAGVAGVDGTIGTYDIQNSSITTYDVKNGNLGSIDLADNSVQGADVKDDTLQGADIDESKLGKVPEASNADNANSLGGHNAFDFAQTLTADKTLTAGTGYTALGIEHTSGSLVGWCNGSADKHKPGIGWTASWTGAYVVHNGEGAPDATTLPSGQTHAHYFPDTTISTWRIQGVDGGAMATVIVTADYDPNTQKCRFTAALDGVEPTF